MKHLVIGDIHGYHRNLRNFLTSMEVIDKKGHAINRDEWKVICTGDLIDGNMNRQGDIKNLEYALEWFDAVCLGNHEFAFLGGHEFGNRRKYDRKTLNLLTNLVDVGLYVPAYLIEGGPAGDFLAVHGGFSKKFGFDTAADAYEYLRVMWEVSDVLESEIAVFNWQGPARGYSLSDPTGGIFELDWSESRNTSFNQIVGHSTHYDGPIHKQYVNHSTGEVTNHWNIDVGGKGGKCVGGIVIDDVAGTVDPAFWGDRKWDGANKKYHYPKSTAKTDLGDQSLIKIVEHIGVPVGKELVPVHETKIPYKGERLFTDVPLVVDDVAVEILDDPEILEVYRQEVSRGSQGQRVLH